MRSRDLCFNSISQSGKLKSVYDNISEYPGVGFKLM